MFPLSDSTPQRTTPFINYTIILLNLVVFYFQLNAADFEQFIMQYAFVPADFNVLNPLSYYYVFTSMFMHGGFMHIISNLWFLHIFGDNVEDAIGHFSFLLFYLAGGVVATLAQYYLDPTSTIPLVGASGAISAVAGAYFVFYRNSSVKSLVVFIGLIQVVKIPVWLFLGYWFAIQVFSGIGSLATIDVQHGGVAWFAHVGGFVFGYFLAKTALRGQTVKPVPAEYDDI